MNDYSKKAAGRALELLDITISRIKKDSRLNVLLRLREALVDFFYGVNEYSSSEIL